MLPTSLWERLPSWRQFVQDAMKLYNCSLSSVQILRGQLLKTDAGEQRQCELGRWLFFPWAPFA
ncbi:unnamed protein product [Symbiodinium pilosum]|uniref:Uncharacterized protein n=1 Tax=Symbiodinium pilosum TaxID=2952 RepID=A0A812MLB5_SYMPI|nr:unnamed protein product [Symbiodinium pilosum]